MGDVNVRMVLRPSMDENKLTPAIVLIIEAKGYKKEIVIKAHGLDALLVEDAVAPSTEMGYVLRQWAYERLMQREDEKSKKDRTYEPEMVKMAES